MILPFSCIWERYFFKELMRTFIFFIGSFYTLYVLIDFSNHTAFHSQHVFQWKELFSYYFYDLISRLNVILPFTLMLATIKTLSTLSIHNELVALMASGISLKTLLRPFLLVGIFFTLLLYVNTELLLPDASKGLKQINDRHTSLKNKLENRGYVQHIHLEDGSEVLFQYYDEERQFFFDAFWVLSPDEVYRIKYLYLNKPIPTGRYVNYLTRNSNDELVEKESLIEKEFPDMRFNQKKLRETLTLPEDLSLSDLAKQLPTKYDQTNHEKEAQITANFYYKVALPWLALFAVIAPAPACMRFTRNRSTFMIYAFCIFGLITFYLTMDAALILAQRQVLKPLWAIWPPFVIFFASFFYRFVKL